MHVGCLDLLQVLSILTMERPVSFSAEDIRNEKVWYTGTPWNAVLMWVR